MSPLEDIIFSCSYKDIASRDYIPFACSQALTNIGADTASQLASAGRVTGAGLLSSQIAMQEIIKSQNGVVVAGAMSSIVLSSYEKIMLEEAKRIQEMQESIPKFHVNPSIYSFCDSSAVSFELKIDEEITIKKSQWNSLQEELATKDQRITCLEERVSELEKKTIPNLDRKVNDAMKEFHTDMEKNMPDVLHVSKYLYSMESEKRDSYDDLES